MNNSNLKHSVHIFVFNERDELLICKRPSTKKKYPDLWTSSAGGRVESGEDYAEAAERELYEELQLRTNLEDVGKFHVISDVENRPHKLFIAQITSSTKIIFDTTEVIKHEWLSLKNLQKDIAHTREIFAQPFLQAFKHFNKTKN